MLRQAQHYLLRGAPRKAASLYARMLAAAPGDPGAWLWRAAALAECGRFPEARDALGRAVALRPEGSAARLFRARVLFDAGEAAAAGEVLQPEAQQDGHHYARALLAACQIRRGEIESASRTAPASLPCAPWLLARLLAAIEAALDEAPEPPEPLPETAGRSRRALRRGLVLLRAERWQPAYRAFRRAENAGVSDPRVAFGLGLSLYYLGHSAAARERLLPVLSRLEEPFHSDALATLGKADLDLGRPGDAVLRLRRAIAAGAQLPDHYYALGLAFLRRGRPDLARRAFQMCVSPPFVRERLLRLVEKYCGPRSAERGV